MSASAPGVWCKNLTYRYRRSNVEIGPISLDANAGEIWAVLGANGAGKTTFFNMLSGVLPLHDGRIEPGSTIDLIPQGAGIPGRVTVMQALRYLALLKGCSAKDTRALAASAMKLCNIAELSGRKVNSLSGGQARRVVIAQALIGSPDVVLMDEPSAGLDIDQRATLKETISAVAKEHAVLVSSHIIEDLAGIATHVLHLVNGKVVFHGSASDYLGGADDKESPIEDKDLVSTEKWVAAYHHWNRR